MNTRNFSVNEEKKILSIQEDHFNDLKSKRIAPKKLQESFVAFANADGGEIWIGVEDEKTTGERVQGFIKKEEANDILHTLLSGTQPSVENVDVEFIDFHSKGLILHLSIPKSPKVHYTSSDECFVRINARKDKLKGDQVTQLEYAKGSLVYEKQAVDICELEDFTSSPLLIDYLSRVESGLAPNIFLKKQRLLTKKNNELKPNVACVLLFDQEPQATLDTRCAIKVYRLLTTEPEYKREQLKEDPTTINGSVEEQILSAKRKIRNLLEDASV